MAKTKKKFDAEGLRLTDCCGATSTFMDSQLVCRKCLEPVEVGEGDGTEHAEKCTVCRAGFLGTSGSTKDLCPKCYQRKRRRDAGQPGLAPGEVAPESMARGGGRELRAMCSGEVADLIAARAAGAGVPETEYVRRALAFIAGVGEDPREPARARRD